MKWLTNPITCNYVIMTLYLLAMLAHAAKASWWFAAYWFFALGITVTVHFGMRA